MGKKLKYLQVNISNFPNRLSQGYSSLKRIFRLVLILGQREQQLIKSAIETFQFLTCLQFQPWNGDKNKDYLHFQNSQERPG